MLVGPSAVGKSTVVAALREQMPDLVFSVSATTRDPRPGEVDGRDYYFVSRPDFDAMIDRGELLEWADIHGGLQRSGTPAGPVNAALEAGHPVLVEVDLVGSRLVRQAMPEAVTVFLAPPSWAELERRLRGRGTESPEAIERRLATAKVEMEAQGEFGHVVVNDDVDASAQQLVNLLIGP
ncbi:guanylate kinase [Gordonia hirsuta DSM 44140 = NBRC 16056]|uniref:Guanylate kinase n=1 Tax=Gordonia hirsuta DSM 44140 = NBRC 16056 TaxID=1121927 RepID=L7L849_9ACTN|nr:guanylate kinase [Gordonia hirsuta DSM 44140 = NBRC 16056]